MKKIHPEISPAATNPPITKDAIADWLSAKIGQQAGISPDEIDIGRPFLDYGLHSPAAMNLLEELGQWLGQPLCATLTYDYPNIDALARYLAGTREETPAAKIPISGSAIRKPTNTDSIAIIGLGCRFPKAGNPQQFWRNLKNGVDAIGKVPKTRWTPTDADVPRGGFIDDVEQFDPAFFDISPREARTMDPQQRLLLEVGWEALENAGIPVLSLAGSQTGVFIGIVSRDYYDYLFPTASSVYFDTGNHFSITANRLSYVWDLRGPSKAIDTACSASLAALHDACQSLRLGECDLALAGGVNLMLSPKMARRLLASRLLSPQGHCRTFDADANGYVRGEGCGVIVLKRTTDAIHDSDPILAQIKGSAINQDGRTNGITAPNGLAQQAVVRQALANAGVNAQEIGYIEAHGTGTPLGDPIEFNAIQEVLMSDRSPGEDCYIGSVKTNIGHLEPAAGIAGVIKTVLALQHREIPPHLHLEKPNPHLAITETSLSIPLEPTPWPSEQPFAGISSFGFGGTNVHVILGKAPAIDSVPVKCGDPLSQPRYSGSHSPAPDPIDASIKTGQAERPCHLLTLSAKSEAALRQLAESYATYLQSHPDVSLADISFTANTGRSHFDHRLALVAESPEEAERQLRTASYVIGKTARERSKLAFLFTGQDSQYQDMGRQLSETQPLFHEILDQCDAILRPLGVPLRHLPYPTDPIHAQPALFALEYALAKLWQSWGVVPDVIMGHDVGEYVAACIAGIFGLEDGLKLITARSHLTQILETGDMPTEFEKVASSITYARPQIPLCSGVTGEMATDEITTSDYWVRHARQPVRFGAGIQTLFEQGFENFLEIGPQPILLGIARRYLPDGVEGTWLPSLRQGQDDWGQLLRSLGEWYTRGGTVDWAAFDRGYTRRKVHLPTYPFQRQRCWFDKAFTEDTGTTPPFYRLLQRGNTRQLARQLERTEQLSEEERRHLPRFLEILAKQFKTPSSS
uniref:Acyl transferase domain-containing protein n=1 Tax=Candidatus Kentrum sp. FW TaxID=2126338 RepID=A0A450SA96_9GAMM|nr:MAG: Acyl transferase domain-containing protein [Candidatus Kentron sp. FW]